MVLFLDVVIDLYIAVTESTLLRNALTSLNCKFPPDEIRKYIAKKIFQIFEEHI